MIRYSAHNFFIGAIFCLSLIFFSCLNSDFEKQQLITEVEHLLANDLREATHEVLDNSTFGIGSKVLNAFASKNSQDSILLSPFIQYINHDLELLENEDLEKMKLNFSDRMIFLATCINNNKSLISQKIEDDLILSKGHIDSMIEYCNQKIESLQSSNQSVKDEK